MKNSPFLRSRGNDAEQLSQPIPELKYINQPANQMITSSFGYQVRKSASESVTEEFSLQ